MPPIHFCSGYFGDGGSVTVARIVGVRHWHPDTRSNFKYLISVTLYLEKGLWLCKAWMCQKRLFFHYDF
jgi:hypothetical protein